MADKKTSFHEHLKGEGEAEHLFNPKKGDKLHAEERLKELKPNILTKKLQLKPGEQVLDLGTGAGLFLEPLRREVGAPGKVIGTDISEEMLCSAEAQFPDGLPENIMLKKNSPTELPLHRNSVDGVLMVCLLHELSAPEVLLREVRRVLKSSGRIVALDWKKQETEKGPPVDHRVSKQEAATQFKGADFSSVVTQDWSENYYLLLSNC